MRVRKDSSEEPRFHNRPLSLIDEQVPMPMDALEALLESQPSRSLPTTPLAKKRSENVNYCPPISPVFAESTESPTNNVLISVPAEIHCSEDEKKSVGAPCLTSASIHSEPRQEPVQLKKEISAWDQIRELLLKSDQTQPALSGNSEGQEWAKHSTGIEQLRAFLSVCD